MIGLVIAGDHTRAWRATPAALRGAESEPNVGVPLPFSDEKMNWPHLIAAALALLAFGVHALVGDKEFRTLRPAESDRPETRQNWVQTRSGWHWVSVDLLLSGTVLLVMATTDKIAAKAEISSLLSIYFLCCGIAWLGTVLVSKTNNSQVVTLGQWVFCFLMSGLIYAGA